MVKYPIPPRPRISVKRSWFDTLFLFMYINYASNKNIMLNLASRRHTKYVQQQQQPHMCLYAEYPSNIGIYVTTKTECKYDHARGCDTFFLQG